MVGSKYSDETRELIKQMLAAGKSVPEITKATGVSRDVVFDMKKRLRDDDEFQRLATQKKDDFIAITTRIINKGLALMEKQIDKADKSGENLDLSKLNTTVGTLYDKRALTLGESTENHDIRIIVDIEDV